ncbi:MAG: hypothetical protein D6755_01550 [Anaerolineae bacterium]|nr:MAG: hypothetical protein D6755_01550 [Anaerolineae bacterium]
MSSPYRDDTHLYTVLQHLFETLQHQNGNALDALTRSRLVIRLETTAPQATVLIDGRMPPVQVHYGNQKKLRPDLDVRLQAETLHRILLDELSLKEALARRQVHVRGPIWKATALGDIFTQGRKLYPEISAKLL